MTPRSISGWVRLFVTLAIVSTIGLFLFVFESTTAKKFLLWIEFSSASPGLSGAFILFSLIATFIGCCFVVSWIASGFRRAG